MTAANVTDEVEQRAPPSRHLAVALAIGSIAAAILFAMGSGFDLDPFDSSELALAAVTAGLGHPPGQPLHTILGWLMTRGPWRPLAALAWLSIAPAVAMLSVATWHGARESGARPPLRLALAIFAPCVFVPVLESVCRVEVYALGAALAVAAVVIAARQNWPADLVAGVLAGLAAATNPVLGVQAAGAAWVAVRAREHTRWGALGRVVAGGLLGLTPYAYAWAVRSRETQTIVWGAPSDLGSFYALLSGQDFLHNRSLTIATMGGNLVRIAWDLARAGVLPFWCLGAWGLLRGRTAGDAAHDQSRSGTSGLLVPFVIAAAAGMLLVAVNNPYRPANPDYGGYYLAPIGLACAGVARLIADRQRGRAFALVTLLIAAISLPGALARARSSGATRALATELLTSAPHRAIIVVGSDHLLFPALYLQRAEGLRADVTLLNPGWASSAWAWRYAMARDPGLRVDLSPAPGRTGRLVNALRSREPGRAVLSESLALLASAAPGPVCPRGIVWSSREGCVHVSRFVSRGLEVLQTQFTRARNDSWDAKIVMSTGRSMADQSLTLGCRGLAVEYYSSALGQTAAVPGPALTCDGIPVPPPASVGLLEISTESTRAALATLRGR